MADNILKLKVESSEYDAKLKKAAEGIRHLAEVAHKGGGDLTGLEKAELDYVKALGSMETKSRTAAGGVRELESTFKELTVVYNHLNDVEKQDEGGKALRESLDQIRQRAQAAKKELSDVTAELNDKQGGKGGFLSGMGGKMGGAMQVFAGNMMTKAAGVGVNLAMEMADMVKQGVELARQGEGIRIAFERLGRGDILDGLREATHGTVTDIELMKAAVKFNDFKLPLDQLGVMLAFAQQKAKDTGQSVDAMVDSIVTGLGRKSLMILDNLGLSASEIKERMAETGDMTKAVGDIIRDQMAKAGDYVETAADRAQHATVAQQNKMEELGRKMMPLAEESAAMWNSIKIGGLSVIANVLDPMISKFTHLGRLMAAQGMSSNGGGGSMNRMIGMLGNGQGDNARSTYNRQVAAFNRSISARRADVTAVERWQRGERSQELKGTMNRLRDMYGADFQRVVRDNLNATISNLNEYKKRAQQLMSSSGAVPAPVSDTTPTGTTGGTRSASSSSRQQTEMQQNQTRINELTQQYVTLMAAASEAGKPLTDEQQKQTSEIQRQISELEKRNGQLKLYQEQAQGKLLGPDAFRQQLSVDVAVNNKKIEELEKQLLSLNGITIDPKTVKVTAETDEARQKVEELMRQIAELKDQNLMINAGMASLDLQNVRDLSRTGGVTGFVGTGKSAMPVEGLPSMSDEVRQRGGNLLDDKATKAVDKEEKRKEKKEDKEQKSVVEGIDQLNGGISNIFGGLEQIGIEIPDELKSIFGVVQGVTSILMGIATTIIAIEALVGADTLLPFAKGGIVPKFAEGGVVPKFADGGLVGRAALGIAIPGNSMSGDNLRLPVDGGRGVIGVNSGEVILNRAQAGVIASDLQGGGMQNMHLDAVISGEQIRLVLNNNGRRTGRGEYVQSTRRRG